MKLTQSLWYKAAVFLALATLVCGALYGFAVTGIAQLIFPSRAQGESLIASGKDWGSALLGQPFNDAGHLWGRPMITDAVSFAEQPTSNSAQSSSPTATRTYFYAVPSNISPASETFDAMVRQRIAALRGTAVVKSAAQSSGATAKAIPVDLVTCSGSGLDPDISPAAAYYQVPRISRATGISWEKIKEVIKRNTTARFLGIFGEPHVNVLRVNGELMRLPRKARLRDKRHV